MWLFEGSSQSTQVYQFSVRGAAVQWKMQAYFESFVVTQIYFEAVLFGSKIFAMCLICFTQAIYSSPLIHHVEIFPDHRQ